MSELTTEQRRQNVIAYGQAMVKIVKAADHLYPNSQRLGRMTLKVGRWLDKKRLRELMALVPADTGEEILAASDTIAGSVGDVNLN